MTYQIGSKGETKKGTSSAASPFWASHLLVATELSDVIGSEELVSRLPWTHITVKSRNKRENMAKLSQHA